MRTLTRLIQLAALIASPSALPCSYADPEFELFYPRDGEVVPLNAVAYLQADYAPTYILRDSSDTEIEGVFTRVVMEDAEYVMASLDGMLEPGERYSLELGRPYEFAQIVEFETGAGRDDSPPVAAEPIVGEATYIPPDNDIICGYGDVYEVRISMATVEDDSSFVAVVKPDRGSPPLHNLLPPGQLLIVTDQNWEDLAGLTVTVVDAAGNTTDLPISLPEDPPHASGCAAQHSDSVLPFAWLLLGLFSATRRPRREEPAN